MFTRLTLTDLPAPLRGPVIVDDLGRPRFWAVAWSVLALNDTAPATKEKRLRYLESLYAHSDRKFGLGSLDSSLSLLDMDRLSRILETWFISIANQPKQSSSDEARWQTGYEFVKFVVSWKVRSPVSNVHLKGLQSSLDRLTHLYKQLRVQKPRQADRVRSLPANIVQSLYEHLDPSSKANPFTRNHTRWLVYASFILLLHQGLRRGELLLLPLDAIKSGFDSERNQERFWINIQSNPYEDEDSDPRFGTRNPVGPVATVFPEFIARDGQERAAGGRQGGKRRVGAARRRNRGHGPARLDAPRPRATVADMVMKSGGAAGQATAIPCADRTQEKRAGPDRGIRAVGVSDGSP